MAMWNTMSVPIRRPRTVSESLASYPELSIPGSDLSIIAEEEGMMRLRPGSFSNFDQDAVMMARTQSLRSRRSVKLKPKPAAAAAAESEATVNDAEAATDPNMETDGQDAHPEVTLRHRDFCPRRTDQLSSDGNVEYEHFSAVMKRANKWISDHPDSELVTVESITWSVPQPGAGQKPSHRLRSPSELVKRGNQWLQENLAKREGDQRLVNEVDRPRASTHAEQLFTDSSVTHRSLNDDEHNRFYRGIRIWYFSRGEKFWQSWASKRRVMYRDYIPGKSDSTIAILHAVNENLRDKPIKGHVIRLETLHVPCDMKSVTCVWHEDPTTERRYCTILRLIYIEFEGAQVFNAEIGLRDFCPSEENRAYSSLGYEKFEDVFGRSARWLFQQRNCHVVNLQTVPVKMKSTTKIDDTSEVELWEGTSYQEHGDRHTDYMMILRVAFWRLPEGRASLPPRLSYRTATPEFLGRLADDAERIFMPQDYEEAEQTVQSINRWLDRSQGRLLGLETLPVRCHSMAQATLGPEATFLRNVPSAQAGPEHVLYCIRIYLDGDFQNIPFDRKWRPIRAPVKVEA